MLTERPQGRFERKLYLSDNLNTDAIEASYDHGVLSLRIPVSRGRQAPQGPGHLGQWQRGDRPGRVATTDSGLPAAS